MDNDNGFIPAYINRWAPRNKWWRHLFLGRLSKLLFPGQIFVWTIGMEWDYRATLDSWNRSGRWNYLFPKTEKIIKSLLVPFAYCQCPYWWIYPACFYVRCTYVSWVGSSWRATKFWASERCSCPTGYRQVILKKLNLRTHNRSNQEVGNIPVLHYVILAFGT